MYSAQVGAHFRRALLRNAPRELSRNALAAYSSRYLTLSNYKRPNAAPAVMFDQHCALRGANQTFVGGLGRPMYLSTKLPEEKEEQKPVPSQIYATSSLSQTVLDALKKVPGLVWDGTISTGMFLVAVAKDPKLLAIKTREAKEHTMDTLRQYWLGTKLLYSDVVTTRKIVVRMIKSGRGLTRRERNLLVRTTSDIFRLVPVAFFVIVPFMELALPFALKLFPNMLPSTFQDKLKKEEDMKKLLQARLGLNHFLQETMEKLVRSKKKESGTDAITSANMEDFMRKARSGYTIENEEVVQFAKFFPDDLLLDNLSRAQLVNMCQYMGLHPYGSDNFLIFQLRNKFRSIVEDDKRILWEGVHSLTYLELQEACQVRGMRHMGLTTFGYRRQLQQWIDLSIKKELPIALLIMSRAFNLDAKDIDPATALKDSIGTLDDEVLDEVLLEVASGEESTSLGMRIRNLNSVKRQNTLIEEEYNKRLALKTQREEEKRQQEEEEEQKKLEEMQQKKELEEAERAAAVEAATEQEQVIQNAKETMADMAQPEASQQQEKEQLPDEPVLTEQDIISEVSDQLKPSGTDSVPKRELSLEELQSLESLVEKDLIGKEKAALEEMKAKMEALKASDAKEKIEKEVPPEAPEEVAALVEVEQAQGPQEDKRLDKMTSKLTDMLDKLELDIKEAEEILAPLDILDKDNDGFFTRSELEDVLKNILKIKVEHETLEHMIDEIDEDADGLLSVGEVRQWIKHRLAVEEARREASKEDVEEQQQHQEAQEAGDVEETIPSSKKESIDVKNSSR